jgi:hypothetical protein
MKTTEFNIEYFKFLRLEILQRIGTHYKLVLAKFGLTGALFAFFWNGSQPPSISPFLVASIFSFLCDIVILENLGWIRSAGAYIKQNIENIDRGILKWEHDFAHTELRKKWSFVPDWKWLSFLSAPWRCFSPLGYILGAWSIGAALWFGHLYLADSTGNRVDRFLSWVGCYLMAYTAFLVFRNLAGRVPMPSNKRASPITRE